MNSDYKIMRADCGKIILDLTKIIYSSGLGENVDFIVYGSFYQKWYDGLSDLDGMLYFKKPPLAINLRKKIGRFQKEISKMYESMPFLKPGQFLYDIFILDPIHGKDGRFMIFDDDWIKAFWKYTAWRLIWGKVFIYYLKPVAFRNQNEFELAVGLHKLRNYWFFEIPRPPLTMSLSYAVNILKFFKVLPRTATIITGRPMTQDPRPLEKYFPDIDFRSLIRLWEETSGYESQRLYLKRWHEPDDKTFVRCLECFESTLVELVENYPIRSRRNGDI